MGAVAISFDEPPALCEDGGVLAILSLPLWVVGAARVAEWLREAVGGLVCSVPGLEPAVADRPETHPLSSEDSLRRSPLWRKTWRPWEKP
jgi:hypothetical protein